MAGSTAKAGPAPSAGPGSAPGTDRHWPAGRRLRLATRGSPLARVQAERVADRLRSAAPGLEVEMVVVRTRGDRQSDVPLDRLGGQGAFAKEVQAAVLGGDADVAVHSAKDLPSATPDGLALCSVPERLDQRDGLVGAALGDLGPGAVVATGAARRRAQLANLRPDLTFVELRGNMGTRLARAGDGTVDAVVVAMAAVERLGWADRVAEVLPVVLLLPQVGQGALALECRDDDQPVRSLLAVVDDDDAHRCLRAERAFLASVGGSCSVPVAAHAEPLDGERLRLDGLVASGDGRVVLRRAVEGADPGALGERLADALLGEAGGAEVLDW
jgi:hydroxymethylbilane synthase